MFDSVKEECGVFGIYDAKNHHVTSDAYLALYALQHRGQESCGIAVNDHGVIRVHKDIGLVPEVFNRDVLEKLGKGHIAVGHVRYSTTGNAIISNAQPLVVKHIKGSMVLAHNGNLVNAQDLREELEMSGAIFHTTNDTEVIAYIITRERLKAHSIEEAVANSMEVLKGAFSLVIMSPQKLIAARDPFGFRPLCIGERDGAYLFASETCALDTLGAKFVRDVLPGEVVVADENGLRVAREGNTETKTSNLCVFEYIYFARPDSVIQGQSVHYARQNAGRMLYEQNPVEADVVIGVPDSGIDAALGYSAASGIPYGIGFIKNRYIGRTFIQPNQGQRENSVRIKLNVLRDAVKGKRVIMIDDSIVRGTTIAHIVDLLREAGATQVHVRISAPPFRHPCYFGTDIDSRDKLIACRMTIDEICRSIGADSLEYLSIENLQNIAPHAACGLCDACFSGRYPVEPPKEIKKDRFETKITENF